MPIDISTSGDEKPVSQGQDATRSDVEEATTTVKKVFDLENLESYSPEHNSGIIRAFSCSQPQTQLPQPAIDEKILRNGFIGQDGYLYGRSFTIGASDRPDFESAPLEPLAYHRVDSSEILYESKPKKPKFIGKYLLGDVIGEGAYSYVKECLDTVTFERRAAKIMEKKRLRKIPNGEKNVQIEIQLLKKLNHENLIRLYDVVYKPEKEKLYIFTDFCVTVLQEVLNSAPNKRLPIHQAHDYFVQLINGLEYIHSQGIIHKDIKPGNLLLSAAGIVKITDFGISQKIDRFSQSNNIEYGSQGTPRFVPPEIANGQKRCLGSAIDIWSAGVTLYNITSGTYPFLGETVFQLFDAISQCQFEIPSGTDSILENLLIGLLQHDPAQRLTINQIRQHDWYRKKHPRLEPLVKLAKNEDPFETTSVLPYLQVFITGVDSENLPVDSEQEYEENDDQVQLFNYLNADEEFDINENDYEKFSAQLKAAGHPSSSGSIARLNELTINSIMSNASRASKTSRTSLKSWTQMFKMRPSNKTKSSNSNATIDSAVKDSNRLSRLFSGLRTSKP